MPRVSGHQEIHNLYSPKSRLGAFPGANWKFLLHSAANLARAFAVVHEHGHLVGDINHGNVLVSSQATVRLIDCDSFQLLADGRQFLCEVGVSTHVPPELQGGSLRVLRTQNHDAFGLAVLIFQILFMGRHPYSGRYLGPGDMPIEKAIREHRFAYGALAPSRQMRQPPNTLDLAMASQPVAGLFERAFSSMASQGAARPGAREWATAIEGVKTATCARNSAHLHLQGLPACPWCDLESRTGTIFFYSLSIDLHADTFHLTAVWARIAAIPGPGPLPALPEPRSFPTAPSPATQAGAKTKRIRRIVAVVLTIAGVAGGLALGSSIIVAVAVVVAIALATTHTSEGQAARQRFRQAQDSLFQLQRQWPQQAGDEPFQSKLAELNRLQNEHRGLPALRQKKLAELEANRWNAQLEKFLDRYRIDQARIPNIGPGRTATLQSFGIETAQDVRPLDILRIPGFGSGLTDNLMAWRRSIEAKFVYDPSRGIDPADVQALDRNLSIRREQIERALLAGGAELEKIKYQISIRRQAIYQQVEAAARAVAQAEADFRVL
jgi:DNA-binding helix-hairpin-helix protein with protein kinase domain